MLTNGSIFVSRSTREGTTRAIKFSHGEADEKAIELRLDLKNKPKSELDIYKFEYELN